MDWLFFALLSTASFAMAVIADKYLLGYIKSISSYLVALIIFQQIFVIAVIAFMGTKFIYPISILEMLTGAAQAASYISYLRALKVEEASRVTSLIFVYPLFVFVGAAVFLGEVLTLKDYVGGTILVISAFLVSYRMSNLRQPTISPALKHIFFFWIFSVFYALEIKHLLSFVNEWHLFIWSSIGALFAVVPLLADREILDDTFKIFVSGYHLRGAMLLEEVFDFLGRLASLFAFALGPVALVSAIGAMQPSMTLICILALSRFVPGVINEELDRKSLTLKFMAGVLMVVGIYLIS